VDFSFLAKVKMQSQDTNLRSHGNTEKLEICRYGDAGIIFVSVEDPYSRLTRSISKCEYSAIGFYAPSNSTGVLKIIVTLVDLFGVDKPTWLNSGCTLDKLIENPLVTRLAIKPLRVASKDPQKIRSAQGKFRACICRGTELVKKPTLEETIFSLFDYRPNGSSRPCVTGIDLVNQVVTLYGEIDKIQPGAAISLSTLDELQRAQDQLDQLSVIGMMGLPFAYGDENVDISSYIVDTNLFGELVEIPLPKRDPLLVEAEKQRMLDLYKPYLIKGLSAFVDLILNHPGFFACVSERLKAGRKLAENSRKILFDIILGFSEVSEEILTFFSTLNKNDFPDSRKLEDIKDRLEKEYFTSCLYLNKEPRLRQNSCPRNSCHDLADLKNWVQQVISSAESSETHYHPIVVDMASLVSIVNRLTQSDLSLPNIKKTPSFLLWSEEKRESCQHKLQSGKVIYLDRNHLDLDRLSNDELVEVSYHLNSLDESYDSLREAVSDRLSSLHDVEEI